MTTDPNSEIDKVREHYERIIVELRQSKHADASRFEERYRDMWLDRNSCLKIVALLTLALLLTGFISLAIACMKQCWSAVAVAVLQMAAALVSVFLRSPKTTRM